MDNGKLIGQLAIFLIAENHSSIKPVYYNSKSI
ncbi:hypothetical protein ND16A_2293 [Thalassotalea sp. ND16A]|nr:hypothetical protein ND16A_2293 [Thalassotalea sp. ND16A]